MNIFLVLIVVMLSSCVADEPNKKGMFQSFCDKLSAESKEGKGSFVIRCEVDGYLIVASPYAISSNKDYLVKIIGMNTYQDLSKRAGNESKFCYALVTKKSLINFKSLDHSPVAFNGVEIMELAKDKDLQVEMQNFKITNSKILR